MDKTEYLVKTLSRTKRKDYENYVINRIYHLLNDLEIKPVTQQYVKRPDGKYALIDLYFPQLEVAIECNEFQHNNQAKDKTGFTADELRAEDIISAIGYKSKPREIWIFNNDGSPRKIKDINADIDDIVKLLQARKRKKKAEKNFQPWDNIPDYKKAIKAKKIEIKDNYFFRTNSEIREFFGRHNNYQRSFYTINKKTGGHLWLPHLAIERNGGYMAATGAGHINLLSKDGREIYEWVKDPKGEFTGEDFRRITFAKSRNNLGQSGFKFIGIFKFSGLREIEIKKGDRREFRVHRLTEDGDVI